MTDTRTMVQQFTHDMRPILIATDKTMTTANNVLLESNHSLNSLEALTSPDAPLWQSLEELRSCLVKVIIIYHIITVLFKGNL